MTITIETSGIQETEQLLQVLKSVHIKNINIKEASPKRRPVITKGGKKLVAGALFGICNIRDFDFWLATTLYQPVS